MPAVDETIKKRVFDLPVHRSSTWIFNAYVIEGDEGAVVVDPGLPSTARGASDIAAEIGFGGSPMTMLCTHGHADHLAGMPQLHARGAHAYLPARCEAYLRGERPRNFDTKTALRFLPFVTQQPFSLLSVVELARNGSNIGFGSGNTDFRFPFAPRGFLKDGDALPGAASWTVLATPGHSDDSISLYHADSATLLSGDAVLTLDGRAWFNPECVDSAASVGTEERLRSLEVRHLLPGHGRPIHGRPWNDALSHTAAIPGQSLLARCSRAIRFRLDR